MGSGMERIPPELKAKARKMRREPTLAERKLWQLLRVRRPRFTRQLVIDRYIVDFACRSARVVIELDGGQHAFQADADAERTAYLEREGWIVLRFWNNEVPEHPEGVIARIEAAVARSATHPRPLPSREG